MSRTLRRHIAIWVGAAVIVGTMSAYAFWRDGTFRRALPQTGGAAVQVERALAALEQDPSAWRMATRAAVREAAVAVNRARLDTAEAHYIRGRQYERERDFTHSERAYRLAVRRRPDWAVPYVALGALLGANAPDRIDEARALFERASVLAPELSRPHNSLAIVMRMAGRFDEAEAAARRALELAPDSLATTNNYANLMVDLGRYDEAAQYYERAVALAPEHPKPQYNLACLYSLRGDVQAAVAALSRAIRTAEIFRDEARNDPDFDPIRADPRFQALVNPQG